MLSPCLTLHAPLLVWDLDMTRKKCAATMDRTHHAGWTVAVLVIMQGCYWLGPSYDSTRNRGIRLRRDIRIGFSLLTMSSMPMTAEPTYQKLETMVAPRVPAFSSPWNRGTTKCPDSRSQVCIKYGGGDSPGYPDAPVLVRIGRSLHLMLGF